jgi:hypothetical protein
MARTTNQRNKTIITIGLSIISFGVGMWSKAHGPVTPLPSDVEWLAFVLVALLIPMYTIQTSIQFLLISDVNAIANDLNKAINGGKVVHLGTANDVVPTVIERFKTAKEVLNTYIISETPYPKRIREMVENGIREFIKRDDTRYEETRT